MRFFFNSLALVFVLWASNIWTADLNSEVQNDLLLQKLASGISKIEIPKKECKILSTTKTYAQSKRGILKALRAIFSKAPHQPTNLIVSGLMQSFCLQKREKHAAKFYINLNELTQFNGTESADADKSIKALTEAMRFGTLSKDKTPPLLYTDFIKFLIVLITP